MQSCQGLQIAGRWLSVTGSPLWAGLLVATQRVRHFPRGGVRGLLGRGFWAGTPVCEQLRSAAPGRREEGPVRGGGSLCGVRPGLGSAACWAIARPWPASLALCPRVSAATELCLLSFLPLLPLLLK